MIQCNWLKAILPSMLFLPITLYRIVASLFKLLQFILQLAHRNGLQCGNFALYVFNAVEPGEKVKTLSTHLFYVFSELKNFSSFSSSVFSLFDIISS